MGLTKIFNRTTNNIAWLNGKQFDSLNDNQADVWRVNINLTLVWLADFKLILRADETARANRYVQAKDGNRFIVSRGALRHILGMYLSRPPASIELVEGINKKPQIFNPANSGLYYNVSHSGDWILIAVARSEIGVDIEFINPAFDFNDVMPDIFEPAEIAFVDQVNHAGRFFMLWTRKEALVKATGQGLDENFKAIPGLDGEHTIEHAEAPLNGNWQVTSFDLDQHHLASLACDRRIGETRFWDIDFSKISEDH